MPKIYSLFLFLICTAHRIFVYDISMFAVTLNLIMVVATGFEVNRPIQPVATNWLQKS